MSYLLIPASLDRLQATVETESVVADPDQAKKHQI
jgi:hypothetical protein